MGTARGYVGWGLPEITREVLIAFFPPAYPDVYAHHVTLEYGVDENHPLPTERVGWIVGIADDGKGLQALIVRIGFGLDGTTDRPDGSTYHITWSLDRAAGYRPKDSNTVIREHGWKRFSEFEHIQISLDPQFFPG